MLTREYVPIPCWTLPLTTAPPGALLRTLVAHLALTCDNQGKQSMTLTELSQPTIPAAALVASVSTVGTATIVRLRGEADVFTLPVVVDALARAIADSEGPVIVDLADTGFIDTGTVRAIARAWQFLDGRQRTLTLRSPSRIAVRVLGVLGLSHLIEPDRMTAA